MKQKYAAPAASRLTPDFWPTVKVYLGPSWLMSHIARIMELSHSIEDDTQEEEQTNAIHYEAHFFVRALNPRPVFKPRYAHCSVLRSTQHSAWWRGALSDPPISVLQFIVS